MSCFSHYQLSWSLRPLRPSLSTCRVLKEYQRRNLYHHSSDASQFLSKSTTAQAIRHRLFHNLQQQQHSRRYSSSLSSNKWTVDPETGIVSLGQKQMFQTVIGIEIHAQLDITTKLFSDCPIGSRRSNNIKTGGGGGEVGSSSSTTTSSLLNQKPNTSVWPFDVGVPGFLPRLSKEAVQYAILSSAALGCTIPAVSRFERKHYFYADLPLGYQMTQQRWPLARDGSLTCQRESNVGSNVKKKKMKKKTKNNVGNNNTNKDDDSIFSVRIDRVQLEQDTGKTIVMTNPKDSTKESLVDFNRAGRALIEIVFMPDIRSSIEASTVVETLRSLLKHIGTCDGKMEEGSLRCDLNVSIAPIQDADDENGDGGGGGGNDDIYNDIVSRSGQRVEVKNLNSLRQVQQAAEYEAKRQADMQHDGQPTTQETRTFDVKSGKTVVLRTKEGAKDYRFMPEPDLPPLVIDEEVLGVGMDLATYLEQNLPELPEQARQRLVDEYGLSPYQAGVLTGDPPAIQMFDKAVQVALSQLTSAEKEEEDDDDSKRSTYDRMYRQIPETVANLLCNELYGLVREHETQRLIIDGVDGGESSVRYSKVTGAQLGEVAALKQEGTISNTMAKQLLRVLYSEEPDGASARLVAENRGYQLITDIEKLQRLCMDVIDENPNEVEKYKLGGKFSTKMTKFFLGKAMSASRGNAHPEQLSEVLDETLKDIDDL